MVVKKNSPALNARELTGYLFLLTLVVFVVALAWVATRMFQPKGDWHMLAAQTEIRTDAPTRFWLEARDGARVVIWLSQEDGEWRAFDGLTPTRFAQNCPYAWQPVTGRFEDPCSGAKFGRDGTYVHSEFMGASRLASDLIQYHVELRQKELWVNLDDKMKPAPP